MIIREINETSHDRMFCKQKMVNGRVRGNNITPGRIGCIMAYCQGINIFTISSILIRLNMEEKYIKTSN